MPKFFVLISILVGIFYFCPPDLPANNDKVIAEDPGHFPWGQFKTKEGIKFTIHDVKIGEWKQALPASDEQELAPAADELVSMVAISYELTNETQNRKIDLTKNDLDFALFDEFGNIYNELDSPSSYPQPTIIANKHFPSLYPKETVTYSIFFEAPVKPSQVLNLVINAESLGVADKVSFHLPVVRALPPPEKQTVAYSDDDLKITIPPNLRFIKPGEIIPIDVDIAKIPRPDRIYIIAPFHLYEDTLAAGHYDLRIPKDQVEGPLTVVVLANWKDDDEEHTLSKSFTIMVKPVKGARKICSDDCVETYGYLGKSEQKSW